MRCVKKRWESLFRHHFAISLVIGWLLISVSLFGWGKIWLMCNILTEIVFPQDWNVHKLGKYQWGMALYQYLYWWGAWMGGHTFLYSVFENIHSGCWSPHSDCSNLGKNEFLNTSVFGANSCSFCGWNIIWACSHSLVVSVVMGTLCLKNNYWIYLQFIPLLCNVKMASMQDKKS